MKSPSFALMPVVALTLVVLLAGPEMSISKEMLSPLASIPVLVFLAVKAMGSIARKHAEAVS